MTSKISRAGSASISETVPWQKFRPWYGLAAIDTNRFSPSTDPSTASMPRKPGGTGGSCGWQAIRTLCSFATGTTRSRK